ncbi:MAG: hypothetical protein DMG57_03685 [Acidobacteria bacterium]|nr:MAG: hypothetical protein DMG57_03685 [Acidobacteriota bacterium]
MLRANLYRGNYYRTLGINAFLGRLTTDADEDVSPYPVVLSYGFWQRAFGGRRDVLERSIHLRGFPFAVVGVSPRGFNSTAFRSRKVPTCGFRSRLTSCGLPNRAR